MIVDITYVGKSDSGFYEVFHYLSDGNRPVLEILVDPDNAIWIAGVAPVVSVPQVTLGTVHRHTDDELEAAGIDTEHVCLGSIASYVLPRITTMMARVYCPKSRTDAGK